MTLIEVMVALAILAIVVTVLYEGFTTTSGNKRAIESETDRYHEVTSAMERIVRELSMAYVSAQVNPNAALQSVRTAFVGKDQSDEDRVDFTSFSHQRLVRDAHESDQNELSYFVARDPDDTRKKVLARREQNRVDDDPRKGGTVRIAVHDILEFRLSYLDPQSNLWTDTWDTTQGAMQPNRLPSQVKIVLVVPGIRRRETKLRFGTRATVPIRFALNHAIYHP